jgi:hypothetical protein
MGGGNEVTHVTFACCTSWQSLVRHMKHTPLGDRAEELRSQLRHFENSPDFGDADAVAAIRSLLLLRIREAESATRIISSPEPQHQIEAA